MKKIKQKTAVQKRRLKAKARARLKEREEENERENWVKDRLDWVNVFGSHTLGAEDGAKIEDNLPNDVDSYDGPKPDVHQIEHQIDENVLQNIRKSDQRKNLIHDFSIISWNVLADAYCRRSSHKNLPSKFQSRVFDRNKRQHQIRETLCLLDDKLSPDFFALQEVDPPLQVAQCMKSIGYGVIETVGSSDRKAGRVDSCGLYFCEEKWECLDHETIRLDDLAILRSSSQSEGQNGQTRDTTIDNSNIIKKKNRNNRHDRNSTNNGSLKGFERSFVRSNVTLLARMKHKESMEQVVIVVSHLFWNPAYNYVKLCQAHHVAMRASDYCKKHGVIPIVWCGDFNSQPQGCVHQYLTKGVVNAKVSAPWYALSYERDEKIKVDPEVDVDDTSCQKLIDQLNHMDMSKETIGSENDSKDSSSPKVKYLLDATLNRFCRWLRILGLDAALETEKEEQERTRDGKITIFQRCKDEGRSLITAASKLLNRKDCPPGTYLLDTKSLSNLDSAIVHLLLCHGVKLEPNKMLTRCVVCNGSIVPVHDNDRRKEIFQFHQAPEDVDMNGLDVYQCNSCFQGYWWCEKPTSSASRVKCQASRLLELCIRGGVPIGDEMGMFDFIDVETIKATRGGTEKDNNLVEERLDVVKWLQNENLKNPLPNMSSAYALEGTQKETLPFTNVTFDFVGSLDYILYEEKAMKITDLLYVPKTFEELNDLKIANGHLLPSYDWPSDHLAIGCRISLKPVKEEFKKVNDKPLLTDPTQFPPGPPSAVPWCGFIDKSESLEETPSSRGSQDIERVIDKPVLTGPTQFPPGPPSAVPWCGFIDKSESESVSEPKLVEDSISTNDTLLSEETEPKFTKESVSPKNTVEPKETKRSSRPHGDKCRCGCIPNILSLFEMAELRRQHRLKQKGRSA